MPFLNGPGDEGREDTRLRIVGRDNLWEMALGRSSLPNVLLFPSQVVHSSPQMRDHENEFELSWLVCERRWTRRKRGALEGVPESNEEDTRRPWELDSLPVFVLSCPEGSGERAMRAKDFDDRAKEGKSRRIGVSLDVCVESLDDERDSNRAHNDHTTRLQIHCGPGPGLGYVLLVPIDGTEPPMSHRTHVHSLIGEFDEVIERIVGILG